MSQSAHNKTPRREFLKNTGRVAAASTLAASTLTGKMIPKVYAAEDNAIRAALVGCGGRGTGAAANATAVGSVPVKLVAMADVFENRLTSSHALLKKRAAISATCRKIASSRASTPIARPWIVCGRETL